MTFLQPSYLWGLLALAIPIAIHFWSRKKVQTIKVGSTQFITQTKSKQSKSIQINEWWLLLLRCLIIALLVGILAAPQITTTVPRQDVAYVFEPSLLATAEGRARFEQIPQEGRYLFTEGFPEWEEDSPVEEGIPHYWQLAREMEQLAADNVVVFTYAFAKAVKGKRPTVHKNITWITVDTEKTVSEPVWTRVKKDSVEVVAVYSDATTLSFSKTTIAENEIRRNASQDSLEVNTENGVAQIPLYPEKKVKVVMMVDDGLETQSIFVELGIKAIASYTQTDIIIEKSAPSAEKAFAESDYIVWLSDAVMPETTAKTLRYRQDILAHRLIEPGTSRTDFILTKELNTKVVLEEDWMGHLLRWLTLDKDVFGQVQKEDLRTISSEQLQTKVALNTKTIPKIAAADFSGWLWMVLLFLMVGERIVASIRKQ
ncbi:BatA domain-containing protein [uncultured Dokdonia sp.]|uniref:BatA domain-containing protein n=1 Tax=uncultured Dokdonia sp. TaxID=575653 RepID=UPI00260B085D|nr:BatA domain-containing protein [uncultured Dokdonia sp.]